MLCMWCKFAILLSWSNYLLTEKIVWDGFVFVQRECPPGLFPYADLSLFFFVFCCFCIYSFFGLSLDSFGEMAGNGRGGWHTTKGQRLDTGLLQRVKGLSTWDICCTDWATGAPGSLKSYCHSQLMWLFLWKGWAETSAPCHIIIIAIIIIIIIIIIKV